MAIHGSDHIPDFPDGFIELNPRTKTKIMFWTKEWSLLTSPYKTDCQTYSDKSEFKSKYDCLTKCQNKEYDKICGNCRPNDWTILRGDLIEGHNQFCYQFDFGCRPGDEKNDEELFDIEYKCLKQCRAGCRSIEIESTVFQSKYNELEENLSQVIINKKTKKKILNRYNPAISLANYVANIGGIGGFWIGLSALGTYDITVSIIDFISNKYRFQNN